jgi:hypothetical protein
MIEIFWDLQKSDRYQKVSGQGVELPFLTASLHQIARPSFSEGFFQRQLGGMKNGHLLRVRGCPLSKDGRLPVS